jgi:hypothetical protein
MAGELQRIPIYAADAVPYSNEETALAGETFRTALDGTLDQHLKVAETHRGFEDHGDRMTTIEEFYLPLRTAGDDLSFLVLSLFRIKTLGQTVVPWTRYDLEVDEYATQPPHDGVEICKYYCEYEDPMQAVYREDFDQPDTTPDFQALREMHGRDLIGQLIYDRPIGQTEATHVHGILNSPGIQLFTPPPAGPRS